MGGVGDGSLFLSSFRPAISRTRKIRKHLTRKIEYKEKKKK